MCFFGPKGRSTYKFSLAQFMFSLSASVLQIMLCNYTIGLYGEDFLACIVFCPLKTSVFPVPSAYQPYPIKKQSTEPSGV